MDIVASRSTHYHVACASILIFTVLAMSFPAAASSDTLVIGTQHDVTAKMAGAVLSEAFSRCGISVEFVTFPHQRTLVEANEGRIDGDVMRVEGLSDSYPNLRQVPVPVYYLEMFAFGKRMLSIHSLDDLQGLKVGIERGVLISEQITDGMNVFALDSHKQMMHMLERDRLDVVILSRPSGEQAIEESGLADVVTSTGPALAVVPLYCYLHYNHEDLIPQLATVLKAMDESGEADTIRREVRESHN